MKVLQHPLPDPRGSLQLSCRPVITVGRLPEAYVVIYELLSCQPNTLVIQ